MNSSSHKKRGQILGVISPVRAERLLVDVANLPVAEWWVAEWRAALDRILSRYPEIFGALDNPDHPGLGLIREDATDTPVGRLTLATVDAIVAQLAHYLRRAWDAQDLRHREWYLFEMRREYQIRVLARGDFGNLGEPQKARKARAEVPPITPLEAALYHLQRLGDRARHCPNPECPAPYFITTKNRQRYCSEKCAGVGERESKRKWWHENRAQNRATKRD